MRDYKYKARAPVGVSVSGTRLGECTNSFGEPCYFYASESAYTMQEGIDIANKIVREQETQTRDAIQGAA